ncbi:MAG TPA: APC family permease [Trebonia sp.]|nr:APC family permease [Trebonia sp.]
MQGGGKRKYISWVALAMMTTGSVASLRSAPTMAVFGLASVFLYLVPAILFFVPTSLVSAELASGWKGGVFNWVSQGVSSPMGLLAIWCQFALGIFSGPIQLAYVAATIAYVFDPNLASSGVFTAAIIIGLYWGSVAVSRRGVSMIAKIASSGTAIGTLIPGAILVIMGIVYLAQGNHSAAPMTPSHLLPAFTGLAGLVFVVNNFLAYAGMEMNAVHVDDMEKPARDFPKAIFMAMGLVLAIFILPALAISWVVPSSQISLTAGVMQAFTAVFAHFGVGWLVPLTGIAIVAAILSGNIAWIAGPSKGLLQIGRQYGYLPPYFQKLNGEGIQVNILTFQGTVVTIIALLYAFIPSVSSAYWILSVMTTQVYLIMYVLMFIAAIRLRRTQPDHPRGYRAPVLVVECVVGALASVLAFLIGFVPPSQLGHTNAALYALLILAGILVLGVLPPFLLYRLRKPSWKAPEAAAAPAAGDAAGTAASGTSAPAAGVPAQRTADGGESAAAPASEAAARKKNRLTAWIVGLVVLGLAAGGEFAYKQGVDNQAAQAKANQVTALFKSHGLTVPVDHKTLIDVLGDDGGPVCDHPTAALTKALQDAGLANGAATVGSRPTRADKRVVEGEALVLSVYCPAQLPAYEQYVNARHYSHVING